MGLFEKLFPKKTAEAAVYTYFKTLGGYAPVYTSFEGGVYEMALTRACIHTFATHVSKLRPVVMGPNGRRMERMLQFQPNPWMDTKKYLYRLATIYKTENTAFIVPVCEDPEQLRLSGFYPILPSQAEIVERSGVPYVRFRFPTGDVGVMELDYTGIKGWDGNSEGVDGEPGTTGGATLTVTRNGVTSNVLGQGGKRGAANGSTSTYYAGVTYNQGGNEYFVQFHAAAGLDGKDGADGRSGSAYGSSGSGGSVGNGGSGAGGYTVSIKMGDKLFPTGSAYLVGGITKYTAEGGSGGRGGSGGSGAPGCVILYYGIPKKQISGPVQDKNARRLLDRLGRRIIV